MEMLLGALVVVLVAHPVITPIVLIVWNRRLGREIEDQGKRITQQRLQIAQLERQVAARSAEPGPEAEPAAGAAAETPPEAKADEPEEAIEAEGTEAAAPPVPAAARAPVIARAARLPKKPSAEFEKTLASSWMIWLGAVAIGLSAVFLFTYAIEQGWLGPRTRVAMGMLLGAALIAGGEWLRRHSLKVISQVIKPDYAPPALVASGVFALYASLFSAHALYGLFGPLAAFLALAIVSFAGLALALRHGAFVALMALGGGYLVPALIESDAPEAAPVFLYLFVLTGACLAVMMYRNWWFLAAATVIGALGWPLLWLIGPWAVSDQGVLGAYALGVAALFALFSTRLPVKAPSTSATAWLAGVLANTSGLGFALSGGALVLLSMASGYNEASFVFLGLYAVMGLMFGVRRAAFESLAVVSILVVGLAVLLWPQPYQITQPEQLRELGVDSYRTSFGPFVMPPEFLIFARGLLAFAVGAALGGVAAMRRAATPPVWSAIAAAAPVYFFVIGYWRIGGFEVDVSWAMFSLGIAVFNLLAAAYARRALSGRASDICVAFFATGCTAALALTFTCLLREAWLTVALSVEVLALAWIWSELRVREIRAIIYLVVGAVACRLILNHNILEYPGGSFLAFNWVLYGYGVPALALYLAARFLGDAKSDPLAALCRIGAIAFAFLMVALQLRIWTAGYLASPFYDLFDQSVQTAWWLLAAGLLLRRELDQHLPQAWYGGALLLALAALQVLFGHVFWNNPLLTNDPAGSWPLVNLLGLAYLLPAILFWALGGLEGFMLSGRIRRALRIAAGALVFLYLSLEVRRAFQGGEMGVFRNDNVNDAEIYAYSAVWIAYALVLLGVGVVKKSSFWRYSSLAVLIVTVLKVFLYDMSDLTGLFRVASFLGLGLTLIGIGYVYRRFVFR